MGKPQHRWQLSQETWHIEEHQKHFLRLFALCVCVCITQTMFIQSDTYNCLNQSRQVHCCKQCFLGTQPHLFIYMLPMAVLALPQQSWVVPRDIMAYTPKIFIAYQSVVFAGWEQNEWPEHVLSHYIMVRRSRRCSQLSPAEFTTVTHCDPELVRPVEGVCIPGAQEHVARCDQTEGRPGELTRQWQLQVPSFISGSTYQEPFLLEKSFERWIQGTAAWLL